MVSEKERRQAIRWGVASVVLWLVLFSAGALINSRGFREVLDPPDLKAKGDGAQRPTSKPIAISSIAANLVQAAILYTPTNAAILCALAGLIGGCASNLTLVAQPRQTTEPQEDDAEQPGRAAGTKTGVVPRPGHGEMRDRRLAYMRESPFVSMFRGFIVYLAFMAGILVVVDDPFQNASPSTYLRYVGTVSVIAFTMGYDPTRFEDLLKRVPTMGPGAEAARAERTTTRMVEAVGAAELTVGPETGTARLTAVETKREIATTTSQVALTDSEYPDDTSDE